MSCKLLNKKTAGGLASPDESANASGASEKALEAAILNRAGRNRALGLEAGSQETEVVSVEASKPVIKIRQRAGTGSIERPGAEPDDDHVEIQGQDGDDVVEGSGRGELLRDDLVCDNKPCKDGLVKGVSTARRSGRVVRISPLTAAMPMAGASPIPQPVHAAQRPRTTMERTTWAMRIPKSQKGVVRT